MLKMYSNMLGLASTKMAKGAFVTGLLLIGFGVLILAMPELFAMLAAIVFFIMGLGSISVAVKILLAKKKMSKFAEDVNSAYRENVNIHIDTEFED